jgi:excisionase family DNA binding protein
MGTNETVGLLTVGEVARNLRCSRLTVYRAIDRGELEAWRLGTAGPLRIRSEDVAGYLVPAGEQRRTRSRSRT